MPMTTPGRPPSDYYAATFGRDSCDNAGAALISAGSGYQNAFWDGAEMVYGDGFAVNDVTAHELTHAVTERTAGLEYQDQPGALNESISDQAGWDVDPGDSTMGEDLPIGAIRDMRNPGAYGQPATASQYVCTSSDSGGVHTNSGIPNKVYANLVDSLGRGGAEQVRYRAQTTAPDPAVLVRRRAPRSSRRPPDVGASTASVATAWEAQGVTATWQPPLLAAPRSQDAEHHVRCLGLARGRAPRPLRRRGGVGTRTQLAPALRQAPRTSAPRPSPGCSR